MNELVDAARFEIASREKHWPARVAAGGMTQAEADADIAAWRAIEQLLARGEVTAVIETSRREMSADDEDRLKYLRKSWPRLAEATEAELKDRLTDEVEIGWPDLVIAAQRAIDSRSEKARLAMVGVAGRAPQDARMGALTTIRMLLVRSAHAAGTFAWHHRKAA